MDQASHDVYVIDGRSEVQQVTISATAGNFNLKFGAEPPTGNLSFNAPASEVRDALEAVICPGEGCLSALGPPGKYEILFGRGLKSTSVPQLECLPGSPPLSGGTGCTVQTTINGVNGSVTRLHANGTPSDFSALGSNVLDGRGPGEDQTPQNALLFGPAKESQVALDESSGVTKGEIYVVQPFRHLVDVFAPSGKYLRQLTEFNEGPTAAGPVKPLLEPCGVGVDATGNAYVGDFGEVHKYDPAGKNVANFALAEACTLAAGAGTGKTGGFIFTDTFLNGELFKLDATTGEVEYEVSTGNTTVTVDPVSGHVLTAAGSEVREFDAHESGSAALLGSIPAGSTVAGVAVDGSTGKGGTVYLSRSGVTHLDVYSPFVKVPLVEAKAPNPVGGTTATLRGTISADGGAAASCQFEYLDKATFDTQKEAAQNAPEPKTALEIAEAAFAGAQSVPCDPPGPFTGSEVNAVSAEVEGLTTETEYEFRLVGTNVDGSIASSPLAFETFGKPVVEGGTASEVTATTALISGAVNPRGTETEAAVQYVTKAQFEATEFEGATVVPAPNAPAVVTGTGDLGHATGTGSIQAGSTLLTDVAVETGDFEPGQTITGTGIPPETTIIQRSVNGGGFLLSKQATATTVDLPVTGTSNRVKNLITTAGRFGVGQAISGPGIPTGTTILSAQEGQLVLSKAATERVLGVALSAIGPQPVSVELAGLTPDTPYVFRLVAQSATGAAEPQGKAGAFTTFGPPPPPLPDGRAYEMVTPAQKTGEPYVPESEPRVGLGGTCFICTPGFERERMPMQSTADGGALAFEGDPIEAGLAPAANEYLSRRGAGGWQTTGLSKPTYRDDTSSGTGFKAFSAGLSRAVLLQVQPALTAEAPEGFANLYLQEEGSEALQTAITAEPPNRTPGIGGSNVFQIDYAGANAGSDAAAPFSHVIFQANDALTAEVPGIALAAPEVKEDETDLYEWSEGELRLVNVLPGNAAAAANAVIGSGGLLKPSANFNFDHAISDDGSRIFWSAVPSGQVYVREGASSTLEVPDPGKFLTATPQGDKVLLSDGVVYDLEDKTLTDLTAGQGGFQGIAGASEDLERIYFVGTAVLAGGAVAGKPNLYLWEEGEVPHEGTTTLIATLLPSDNQAGAGELGVWHAAPGDRLVQASPDGRYLAFESRAPLTGFDSAIRDAVGCEGISHVGAPQCFEVFEYDAVTQTLSCASCNPSGEGPLGPSNLALFRSSGEFLAVPQNLPPEGEGRIFFESQDTLVQGDANGAIQDVYEWEPAGVGDCVRIGGCVALISNGRSPKDSHFIAADAEGSDVFFTTRERLVPRDKDDFLDIYDARVGGGFEEEGPLPCSGEACAAPIPAPPPFEAPSSSQGQGEGPVHRPTCRRGYIRRGNKCVRRHRAPKHKHHQRAPKRGGRR